MAVYGIIYVPYQLNMSFFALSSLLNGLGAIWFGIMGYRRNPQKFLYKIFGIMNLSVAVWSFSYFFWQISETYFHANLFVGFLSLGANFIPVVYLHWVLTLLNLNKEKKWILRFFYYRR